MSLRLAELLPVKLARATFTSWKEDYAPSMGAAIAYYTLFSVAPLLLIVISVAGLFFGQEAVRGELFGRLADMIGPDSADAVQTLLSRVDEPQEGALGTFAGIGMLLVGATTVFAELQGALDRIWRAPAREQGSGLWGLVRARLLSFGMILGFAFLLMVSLVVSAAVAALGRWWGAWFRDWALLAHALDALVSFAFITAIFAMIYKWMPRARIRWRDVGVGAAVTAALFVLGEALIGLYLGRSSVARGFGPAASLVVFMVWVYYSAQIFLFGAEFTWVYAHERGSRRGEVRPRGVDSTLGQGAGTAMQGTVPAHGPRRGAGTGRGSAQAAALREGRLTADGAGSLNHGGRKGVRRWRRARAPVPLSPGSAASPAPSRDELPLIGWPQARAVQAVRERPGLALGIAAGIGAVLGAVARLLAGRGRL